MTKVELTIKINKLLLAQVEASDAHEHAIKAIENNLVELWKSLSETVGRLVEQIESAKVLATKNKKLEALVIVPPPYVILKRFQDDDYATHRQAIAQESLMAGMQITTDLVAADVSIDEINNLSYKKLLDKHEGLMILQENMPDEGEDAVGEQEREKEHEAEKPTN